MSNFDCLSCEHGDKCTLYMATGITRCNDYKKKKPAIKDSGERTVFPSNECKHWKPKGSKAGNSFSDTEYIGGCEFTKYCRRESDFCSYGEREEGAE